MGRMQIAKNNIFTEYQKKFLAESYYVAVGGTTWWNSEANLQGLELPPEKLESYGNQREDFLDLNKNMEFMTICLCSNDCDDMEAHLENLEENSSNPDSYIKNAQRDMSLYPKHN